jgi:hypothetical protein
MMIKKESGRGGKKKSFVLPLLSQKWLAAQHFPAPTVRLKLSFGGPYLFCMNTLRSDELTNKRRIFSEGNASNRTTPDSSNMHILNQACPIDGGVCKKTKKKTKETGFLLPSSLLYELPSPQNRDG